MNMQFFTKKVMAFLTLTLIAFSLKSFSAESEISPNDTDPIAEEDSMPEEEVSNSEEELPGSEIEMATPEEEVPVSENEIPEEGENAIPQEEISTAEGADSVPTEEMSPSEDIVSISKEAELVPAKDSLTSPEILTSAVESPVVENKSVGSEGEFSIGGSVGFDYLTPHGRGNDPADLQSGKDYNRYYGGSTARLFLGYEKPFMGNWFVGGQAFVGTHNTDTDFMNDLEGNDNTVNIKQTYSFGMKATLGTNLSDNILVYAHLGIINSLFKIDHVSGNGHTPARTSLWGISPGLGFGVRLDSHWRLNLEAFYTFYERRMKKIDLGGGDVYQVRMEPRELGISVGVSRKLF